MALLAPERHERILDQLRRNGTVTVQGVSDQLNVTKETVRRDFDQLETAGALRRVHGGAVMDSSSSRSETSWRQRQTENAAAKQAIAHTALELMPRADSASIIMDAGSTTEALADLLASGATDSSDEAHTRFLITNALPIAQKLSDTRSIDVEILGGKVRRLTGAVVGEDAITTLKNRQVDVAFIGTNGLHATFGLSTPDTAEAAVKSALIDSARQVVLLADSSKLGKRTLVSFAALDRMSVLITNSPPPPPLAAALDDANVTVMIAEPS